MFFSIIDAFFIVGLLKSRSECSPQRVSRLMEKRLPLGVFLIRVV